MRKRPISIAGIAALATTAIVASVALAGPVVTGKDGNTQSLAGSISPKKLSKSAFGPASLKISVATTSTTAANGVPSPAVHATLDFDKDIKLFTKGIPTCNPAQLQSTSTEVAKQLCGKAQVGGGTASALLPVGSQVYPVNPVVTVFNGVPKGGKPVIILHTYSTTPVQTTLVLSGPVTNLNREGYGPRLDLEVPLLAGGTGALTGVSVKIDKKYSYKGKKRSLVSARCTSGRFKYRATFTYKDGEQLVPTSTQTCKKKK